MILKRLILLIMRNGLDKIEEKMKTHILYTVTFSPWRSCRLYYKVEKCCRAGQTTDVNKTRHMGILCWITKAINTHSEYMRLIAFHCNNRCANGPKYYVLRPLPSSEFHFRRTLGNSATVSPNANLPGWNCSFTLVLLESCLQTCMTYTIAECTVNKLLMMDRRTVRNM